MRIRIHNNDDTDYVDFEADTVEEIREMCKERIALPDWRNGWSEVLDG